jgi:hypothetical protein
MAGDSQAVAVSRLRGKPAGSGYSVAFTQNKGYLKGSESVTVRCGVDSGRVEIKLLYGGGWENPLGSAITAEQDAIAFIRKHSNELNYGVQKGKNVITMVKY